LCKFCENNVDSTQLICDYGTDSYTHWPAFKYCQIKSQNFPLSDKNKAFSFSGSESQKQETTVVDFYGSSIIEFIPLQIFSEFPNLNEKY
jgi:hypothetical protein